MVAAMAGFPVKVLELLDIYEGIALYSNDTAFFAGTNQVSRYGPRQWELLTAGGKGGGAQGGRSVLGTLDAKA
ncbi:MAG: hypothetical protein COZ12_05005 [Deltaproteobacteria bacterium CG_4_10_14_3_um_filter_60_8]|nr:MAG: hypothetical protein AUK28_04895 [Desulfobacterales bacterium CG2_30_60_27]PIY21385.1 MAG: hypothetical protein COZ12_05005 [Deltaproteobacteria bacterium CG_4_10_14_3_um_filter_60_8]